MGQWNDNQSFVNTSQPTVSFTYAADNVTVFSDYTVRYRASKATKIPQIIGTVANEGAHSRRTPKPTSPQARTDPPSSASPSTSRAPHTTRLHPLAVKSYNGLYVPSAGAKAVVIQTRSSHLRLSYNMAFMAQPVENMSQLCVWHVDETLYNAVDNVADGGIKLRSKVPRPTSQADWSLFKEAIRRYEVAYQDLLWRTIQSHADVPYLVSNLSVEIYGAWSRTAMQPLAANSQAYIHPDRALGRRTAKEDADWRHQYQETKTRKWKGKGRTGGKERTASTVRSTVQAMQKELKDVIEAEMGLGLGLTTVERTAEEVPSVLLAQSQIAKTRLGTTASTDPPRGPETLAD
uniref:Uncharacterized protein n=1 Tax=Mycena chlorophos TaxID=658473 RepID=A0ABQ0LHR5_MYCCL|nr:predicted protein [Mycena chlorophos]